MRGDGSLGSKSRKTRHYSYRRCNDCGEISEEEDIEMSSGEENRGHRSLETSHSSPGNRRGSEGCRHKYVDTSHYSPINCGGCGRRYY